MDLISSYVCFVRVLGSSDGKETSAMQKTQVLSLGQEHLLEKEMATHSSVLVREISWTEESGGL